MIHTETVGKQEEILREAHALYARKDTDWVTFYRAVLGVNGAVRRTFRSPQALGAFERTAAYAEIQQLLRKLRQRTHLEPKKEAEPVRVLTIRLPQSLYDSIQTEADQYRTSMNKLCISKLLQYIDESLVPGRKKPPPKRTAPPNDDAGVP